MTTLIPKFDFKNGTSTPANAVNRPINEKLSETISVLDFGADPTGVADSTTAIQAAINYQASLTQSYAPGTIKPPPLQNATIGTAPVIFFPKGKYTISDTLTYFGYSSFSGEQSIIYQTDNTKDIFSSTSVCQNEFNNLQFVGGKRHIYGQNGTNFEGVLIKVYNCNFEANASHALYFAKFPSSGGEQLVVSGCRTISGALFLYTEFDFSECNNSWIEFYRDNMPNDTAQMVAKGAFKLVDCALVPGSDSMGDAGNTRRYIDAYASVEVQRCRFGSEAGGGCPLIYSFIDQLLNTSYPYQGAIISITDCEATAAGTRVDKGFIVAKSGLPQVINISGNGYSFDGPFINTSQFTGGISLATYLASYTNINARIFTFNVTNNSKWAGTLTSNTTDDALLLPWTDYDVASTSKKTYYRDTQRTQYAYADKLLQGRKILQTASLTGTAYFDTGIFYAEYGDASIWELHMTGNPNAGGSGAYQTPQIGAILVGTTNSSGVVQQVNYTATVNPSFNGLGPFTITAVFWNDLSENIYSPNGATNRQIRIKISGYQVGNEGYGTYVYLTRRL
jgi:hypothetical protein